ncbi:MAG: transposon-transfer assisting family protein [Defluviitaleaceae bacterium]|nr:transposon-transfer assisting family protein [Defluviitaleaceae bacterium]
MFTTDEMHLLCVMHSGTLSETIEALERTDEQPAKLRATINSTLEKLRLCLKEGRPVSLMFDSED